MVSVQTTAEDLDRLVRLVADGRLEPDCDERGLRIRALIDRAAREGQGAALWSLIAASQLLREQLAAVDALLLARVREEYQSGVADGDGPHVPGESAKGSGVATRGGELGVH